MPRPIIDIKLPHIPHEDKSSLEKAALYQIIRAHDVRKDGFDQAYIIMWELD